MAQTLSSEDALNRILNILETVMVQENEDKNKTNERKADDTIIELLEGIVEKAQDKAAATAGQQLEELAKGLKAMKEIDNDVLTIVSTSVTQINRLLKDLQVPENINDNIGNFIQALNKLGEIDGKSASNLVEFIKKLHIEDLNAELKNTNTIIDIIQALSILSQTDMEQLTTNLDDIDVNSAEKLVNFIKKLSLSDIEENIKNTKVLVGIVQTLNILSKTDLSQLCDNLEDLDPDIAKNLSKFIKTLVSELEDGMKDINPKKVKKLIKPISDLFAGLKAIVDTNIFKLKISMNPLKGYLLGRQIGQFLHAIMKRIKDDKVNETVKYLADIFSPLATFADSSNKKGGMKQIKKALNKRNAKIIADFFITLVQEMPEKKEAAETMAVAATMLKTLTSIGIQSSIKFIIFTSTFTKKRAIKINEFFKTLTSGKWNSKKLDDISKFIISFNKLLKSLTLVLVVMVATVALFPITAVIDGFVLMLLTVQFVKKTITSIIKELHGKEVKKADKTIKSIAVMIATVGGLIGLIALLTAIVGSGPVLLGFALIGVLLFGVTKMIKTLSNKEFKDGIKQAGSTLKGVALLLSVITGTVIAMTLLVTNADITDIILGMTIVSSILAGTYFMVKKLAKLKGKGLKEASNALLWISASFAIIAGTALLFKEIGQPKHLVSTLLGGLIVSAIVTIGVGLVILLSHKAKRKDISNATNALIKLTLVFAGIALIAKNLLIPIGKKSEETIYGGLITISILELLIGSVYLLSKIRNKVTKGILTLTLLTAIYLGLGILINTIIIPLADKAKDAAIGSAIVLGTLALLIVGIWALSMIRMKQMVEALAYTTAMAFIYLGLSLIIKELMIPIGEQAAEALFGTGVTLLVLAGLILGIFLLSKIDLDNIARGLIYMAGMAFILLGLSLIIKEIILPIGEKAEETLFGSLLVLGITAIFGSMMFGIGLLLKSETVKLAMIRGAAFMAAVAIVLLILGKCVGSFAESARKIWDLNDHKLLGPVIQGGGLLVLIVGILGGIMFALGKFLMKDMMKIAYLIVGGVVSNVIGILADLVAGEMYLFALASAAIYKLNKDYAVVKGGGLIIAILGIMGSIFGLLGLLIYGTGGIGGIGVIAFITGGLLAAAIGGLADVVAGEMWLFAFMCKKVYDLNKNNAVIEGGKLILEIFGIISLALTALSGFSLLGSIGGAVGAIMGLLADIIAGEVWVICKVSADIFNINKNNAVTKGFNVMLIALDKIGDIAWELAKNIIKLPIALVGSFLTATLTPFMLATAGLVNIFIDITSDLLTVSKKEIEETGDKLTYLFETLYKVSEASNPGWKGAWDTIVSDAIILPLMAVIGFCDYAVDKVIDINKKINIDDMTKFKEIIVGKDEDDPDSLIGTIKAIVSAFPQLFTWTNMKKFFGLFMFGGDMRRLFDLISDWIDVIAKAATMNFICGYDENGKPEFEHVDPDDFGKAAHNVTTGFLEFMTKLSDGFEKVSFMTLSVASLFAGDIKRLIDVVSKYVDVIIKVASGTYQMGEDENGKPIYEHIEPEDFAEAATVVTDSFTYFIDELAAGFGRMSWKQRYAIEALDDNMKPIMEAVCMFVDAIMKVATMTIITGYDDNGKPIYEKIDIDEFNNAATVIVQQFSDFVKKLGQNFEKMKPHTVDAIEDLDDNLMPIMNAVSGFVDAIMKLATGVYIKGYDENGKAIYDKVTTEQFGAAADVIVTQFSNFIGKLRDNVTSSNWETDTSDILEELGDTIGVVMDAVGKWVDAILQVASGTYIDSYTKDKDGNDVPHFTPLTKQMIEDAAVNIADTFVTFLNRLQTEFSSETVQKKIEIVKKTLDGGIKEIMESVKLFADTITLIAGIKTTIENVDGSKTEKLLFTNPESIKQLADGIASAFTSFIGTIADALTGKGDDSEQLKNASKNIQQKYKDLKKISKEVKTAMNNIKEIIKSFIDILKMISDYTSSGQQTNAQVNYGDMDYGGGYALQNQQQNNKISLEMAPTYANILCAGLLSFVNIFTDRSFSHSLEDIKKYNVKIKGVRDYFKELNKLFVSYSTLLKNLQIINQESQDCGDIVSQITDIKTNLKSIVNILADNIFNNSSVKKQLNKIDDVNDLLKAINKDILKPYNKLIDKLDKKPEQTSSYISAFKDNLILLNTEMINVNETSKDVELDSIIALMPQYNKIARQYNKLINQLNGQDDVTTKIQAFLNNIKILTSDDVLGAMKVDVTPIKRYIGTLKSFSVQVSFTTRTVNIYVTSMERARKAMKNLDDVIINNKEKRNKALDELCDRITKIGEAVFTLTDAVYEMADAFEYVQDETDILSMFKGTQDLIESVTGVKQNENGEQTQNNASSEPKQRAPRPMRRSEQNNGENSPRGGRTNINMNNGIQNSGTVTFNFRNMSIHGEYAFGR